MKRVILFFVILAIVLTLIASYIFFVSFGNKNKENESSSKIANPASVHCEENNGTLEIRTDAQGNQYGICSKNEKECEEWAFFRGECSL